MPIPSRNFQQPKGLHSNRAARITVRSTESVYALRSLPALSGLVAIPKRFSSSSLPPSFVSGRFAGFYLSAHRAARV